MALPQDGQNANALATVKEVPTGKKLIFVDPTTNEGGIITLEDLTTQILKKLTSQTFALDQGTKTLPAALNELNSKTLIITMSGLTDSTGNIRINVPNSFSRMPYVVTNVRDSLQCPYIVIISGWTQNEINFRIRNASDNSAIINTRLPVFQCMLIGK
jgi:hypothetical protein